MHALGGEQAGQWQHGPHHQGVGSVHLCQVVIRSMQGDHGGPHGYCEVCADGPGQVISGSYDTTLKVWKLKTGICIKILRGHSAPVLAIQAQGNRLISVSGDKTIMIWHLDTGYCAAILAGHNDAVTCLTLDREKQRIVSASLDRTIKVWSIATLECLNTLDWMSNEGRTGVVR